MFGFNRLKEFLRRKWQDFKAWRRGEVRVVKGNVRGRVYASKSDKQGLKGGTMVAKSKGTGTITARIIRADGTIEDLGRIT